MGVVRVVVVPSPRLPYALPPQHWTSPPVEIAHENVKPAETSAAADAPCRVTWTGEGLVVFVPSPSWPLSLRPQHHTLFETTAHA